MNRRDFISALIGAGAGIALEEAIPFNRVWFFPKKIRLANSLDHRKVMQIFPPPLSPEEFEMYYLKPVIAQLAREIDAAALRHYQHHNFLLHELRYKTQLLTREDQLGN